MLGYREDRKHGEKHKANEETNSRKQQLIFINWEPACETSTVCTFLAAHFCFFALG